MTDHDHVSFWTSLLGPTEPLFVPAYWNPPSLFNLAETTGFDIEYRRVAVRVELRIPLVERV